MQPGPANEQETRQLIDTLNSHASPGSYLVSLVLPPKSRVAHVLRMLVDESATACRIKDARARESIVAVIDSTIDTVAEFPEVPPNGLVVFVGGLEKLAFEPFKPIHTSLYLADTIFHTECLNELL